MKSKFIVIIVLAIWMVSCSGQLSEPVNKLKGTWRIAEMYLITAKQDTIEFPVHESHIIFGKGYYSIGYAFGKERQPTYAERWHPTEQEKAARFSSIIVNTGTYQMDGSRIDAQPEFALAPAFVGGEAGFSYRFAGDTLELTWDKSVAFDGLEYPSGGTVTFFRLVRAD